MPSLHLLTVTAVLFASLLPLSSVSAEEEREILYWVAPMDPNYRRDEPGKSPMGMDLIPVYKDEVGDDGGDGRPTVTVSPSLANSLGVRTANVVNTELARHINTVGIIDFDEHHLSHVHLRAEGWIEDLRVRTQGEAVKAGELLFNFYSPQLVNAQEEYLQALNVGDKRLRSASRERLIALGVPERVVKKLEQERKVSQLIPVHARQDGFISQLNIREGMYVRPATEVMTLADLSSVWILVDVFERQADWVSVGQEAEVRLPYLPGEVWTGKVEYIYPTLDAKTRTLKVRLHFDNPGERLKPNMFAKATILASPREALAVPREALIRTGSEDRVVIAKGDGKFQPVVVTSGIESGDYIEIKSGLNANDKVVTSAQFLIDSESSLKASFLRMSEPESEPNADDAHAHHDMSSPEKAAPLAQAKSRGVIHSVDVENGKLNMTHEPIPELGWPAMTMDFNVDPVVSLDFFGADDEVTFEVHQTGQFEFTIVAMDVAASDKKADAPESAANRYRVKGTLHSVNGDMVNLSHEPIPALGWPPMTMDLKLAESVSAKGIAAGSAISFELEQLDAVTYRITDIEAEASQ